MGAFALGASTLGMSIWLGRVGPAETSPGVQLLFAGAGVADVAFSSGVSTLQPSAWTGVGLRFDVFLSDVFFSGDFGGVEEMEPNGVGAAGTTVGALADAAVVRVKPSGLAGVLTFPFDFTLNSDPPDRPTGLADNAHPLLPLPKSDPDAELASAGAAAAPALVALPLE